MYGDFPGDYQRLKDRVRRLELQPVGGGGGTTPSWIDLRPYLYTDGTGATWSDQFASSGAGGYVGALVIDTMVFLRGAVAYSGPDNSAASLTLFHGLPASVMPAGIDWRDMVINTNVIAGLGAIAGYVVGARVYASSSSQPGLMALTPLTKADGGHYTAAGVTYTAGMPNGLQVQLSLDGVCYDIAPSF